PEEPLDRLDAEDLLREGGWDDAPEAVAVGPEVPALLVGEPFGLLLRVDRSDRLRRVAERGVVALDLDLRQQRREALFERQLVAELLLDQVADHPLGLRAEHVERIRVDFGVR